MTANPRIDSKSPAVANGEFGISVICSVHNIKAKPKTPMYGPCFFIKSGNFSLMFHILWAVSAIALIGHKPQKRREVKNKLIIRAGQPIAQINKTVFFS